MTKYKALSDEITYLEVLKSGLRVAVHPKKKYQRTLVRLQVDFGGMDEHYLVNDIEKKIPAGVAHFLEHSLFENNGRNVSEEISKYGGNVNAYTSKSVTAYTFECRENLPYLLSYFLDGFMTPNFSETSIEKEKRIIKHELKMSEDSIHTKIYQDLKDMMYADQAIRSDVGGTVKSVQSIDKAILDDVFNTFYHPKNMSLVITGNVEPETVFEIVRNHRYNQHNWQAFSPITRIKDNKKRTIHNKKKIVPTIEENMINIGIKIPDEIFENYDREFIHIGIGLVINNVFGLGSRNYDYLEKRNLMNISFSAKSAIERDYGFINVYIQTKYQEKYLKEMTKILLDVSKNPLDEALFIIDKKAILGNYIRLFDSLSRTHELIGNFVSENVRIDTYLDKILHFKSEALKPIQAIFTKENMFVVQYLKNNK